MPSNNITELENSRYNISLAPIFVESGEDPILLNMTISALNHLETYSELDLAVDPIIKPTIRVEIIDQFFSTEVFNITFMALDSENNPIPAASFQSWWNGALMPSNNITNLGNGLYKISLSPIFVNSGEAPILLNLSLSKVGYTTNNYKLNISVLAEQVLGFTQLYVEISDETFKPNNFTITFQISNCTGDGIENANIQALWNGVLILPGDITEIGNGYYNIILPAIFVDTGGSPILLSLTISATGYSNKIYEKEIAVQTINDSIIIVYVVDEFFSIDVFKITFIVFDSENKLIPNANIILWWNNVDNTANITNLGFGLYRVSLNPILVNPGDDPITLSMTISATGYTDEYYELDLSVDPEAVDKSVTPPPGPSGGGGAISFGFYFLAIAFLSGIILIIFKKGKISRKNEEI